VPGHGAQALRGVTESVRVIKYWVRVVPQVALMRLRPRGLTPLVGREIGSTLLARRWEQAKAGQGQVILLSGEGGIGKVVLSNTQRRHVTNQPHVCWECRSSSYFENTTPFL